MAGDRRFDLARGAEIMPERNPVRGLVGFDLCQSLLDRARFVRAPELVEDMGAHGRQFGIVALAFDRRQHGFGLEQSFLLFKERFELAAERPTVPDSRKCRARKSGGWGTSVSSR